MRNHWRAIANLPAGESEANGWGMLYQWRGNAKTLVCHRETKRWRMGIC